MLVFCICEIRQQTLIRSDLCWIRCGWCAIALAKWMREVRKTFALLDRNKCSDGDIVYFTFARRNNVYMVCGMCKWCAFLLSLCEDLCVCVRFACNFYYFGSLSVSTTILIIFWHRTQYQVYIINTS